MKHETNNPILAKLLPRLSTYPGAHPNEKWKCETDLHKCTDKEKAKIKEQGISVEVLMEAGLNRGEVAHILGGYKYARHKDR